jgi:hypothetical protein
VKGKLKNRTIYFRISEELQEFFGEFLLSEAVQDGAADLAFYGGPPALRL